MIKDISLDTIYNEDCLETMRRMPDNYLAAIVTDPPYGISFMGKKWDYDVPSVEIWQEALRILKPGGHLLSFAGTRTYHRMAVRIEDAGFEIRDMIEWVYGSGFPKSTNISKQLDKRVSVEAGCVPGQKQTDVTLNGTKDQPSSWDNNEYGGGNAKCDICGKWFISGSPCVCPKEKVEFKTEEARFWEGYGTALKPAHEPCVLARKPIEGTVSNNVLKHGTGGLNIDGTRVGTEQLGGGTMPDLRDVGAMSKEASGIDKLSFGQNPRPATRKEQPTYTGRFPSNLIIDGSDEVVGLFPNTKGSIETGSKAKSIFGGGDMKRVVGNVTTDSGSAARFFYTAKASKSERGESNNHPTVKPVKLMEYLIKLVIPPNGGVIYDPFSGSGTTLLACQKLCISYIGSEISKEYCDIAERRLGQGVLL